MCTHENLERKKAALTELEPHVKEFMRKVLMADGACAIGALGETLVISELGKLLIDATGYFHGDAKAKQKEILQFIETLQAEILLQESLQTRIN